MAGGRATAPHPETLIKRGRVLAIADTLAKLIASNYPKGATVFVETRSGEGDGYAGHFFITDADKSTEVASDPDSGVYVALDNGKYAVRQFGQAVDYQPQINSNWFTSIQAADDFADAFDLELHIPSGTYAENDTITFNSRRISFGEVFINKSLADEPIVIFSGGRKVVNGILRVSNSARPTTETNAKGFVFKQCIHGVFSCLLSCEKVYDGFYNDPTGPLMSWGNNFASWYCRDFVRSGIFWDFSGSGASTENFVGACYINGKAYDGPTLLEVELPMYFNNAEGFTFGTLNIEWCRLASSVGSFVQVLNETTINIASLHFEGNEAIKNGDARIFNISNTTGPANINIGNMHINNMVQNTGRLFLLRVDGSSEGTLRVGSFSGATDSNSISDMRLLTSTGVKTGKVIIDSPKNVDDYFTSYFAGTGSADKYPIIRLGAVEYTPNVGDATIGTTIDAGYSSYVLLNANGAPPPIISDVGATMMHGERTRTITVQRSTGAGICEIVDTGNISVGAYTSPVTLSNGESAVFEYNDSLGKALLLSVG